MRAEARICFILISLSAITAVACVGSKPIAREPISTFAVESVASFGMPPARQPQEHRARGGGALAAPTAAREGPDSSLYVLDMDYKKVAVFNRDGSLRLTFGEYGTAPGQFSLPTAMDVVDSMVLVYDFEQARVTEFDLRGRLLASIPVAARARNVIKIGDRIWLSQMGSTDNMVLGRDAKTGDAVSDEIPVSKADLRFSPKGVAASMGRTPSGDLLVANQRPSLWYVLHAGRVVEHGQPSVDADRAVIVGQFAISPAQSLGIGWFAGDRIGVLYTTRTFGHEPASESVSAALDVYDSSGIFRGTVSLPVPTKNVFSTSRDGESFYVAFSSPYAHVTQFRLIEHPLVRR